MEKVKARLLDADYSLEEGLEVRLFCVDADGDHFVALDRNFLPYFYAVPSGGVEDLEERLEEMEVWDNGRVIEAREVERSRMKDGVEETEVLKIVLDVPPDVPKVREHVSSWDELEENREFDIPFYKRYLIDRGISPGAWIEMEGSFSGEDFIVEGSPKEVDDGDREFSKLAFDLEVYEDRVIMCSFYSEDFRKVLVTHEDDFSEGYVEVVEGEKEMLERIVEIVKERDPDILTGYNTDEFDFDVLRQRAERHNVRLDMGRTGERMKFQRRGRFSGANLPGRIHLDLYAFVENVVSMGMRSETLSLDSVAEEIIGENKDDISWEQIKDFWERKENLDRLAKYALRDSELAFRLGENLIPQIVSLSVLTGLPPFDTCRHTYGQLVENFLLKKSRERNVLAPNRPTQEERSRRYQEGRYAGGFVYEPERGLHENIALFDFRSLYPTIIVAHNISPDVLDVEDCEEEFEVDVEEDVRYGFCQDFRGFIPSILENLVEERYGLKGKLFDMEENSQEYRNLNNRQNALKILSNAFYGYMGYNGARWYSRGCAESTTALGRKYIHDTIERAEERGFEVVYGDTDSIFIKGEDVRERHPEFLEDVNSRLPEFMELEYEGFYPRGLFTYTKSGEGAKKKYALIDEDGNVKITGFEQVRRDWSGIAKDTQEEVIQRVLENRVEEAVEAVKSRIEDLKEGDVPMEKLKIYTRLTKRPQNYKSKSPHSEAAKKAIKRGEEVSPGDTIEYVVTRGTGPISDRAEVLKYADSYDPDYYIEKQVIPVALRVLKVLGYTEDQLLGKGKQSGLERFS